MMNRFRSLIALGVLCMVGALVAYDVAVSVAPIDAGFVAMPMTSAILVMLGWSIVLAAVSVKIATAVARRPHLLNPRSADQTRRQRYDWGEHSALFV